MYNFFLKKKLDNDNSQQRRTNYIYTSNFTKSTQFIPRQAKRIIYLKIKRQQIQFNANQKHLENRNR